MTTIMNPEPRQPRATQPRPARGKSMLRTLLGLMLLALASLASVSHAATVTYYHPDALGSPVAATDEAGKVLWREAYQPYGTRLRRENTDGNTVWFSGKPTDERYGLSYFGARWYSPAIGRFMALDPVGVKAGDVHSFNRYAYANNNPYRYVDPDGRAEAATTGLVVVGISAILIKALPQETQDRLGQSVLDGMEALFSPVYNAESGDDKGEKGNTTGTVGDLLVDTVPDNDRKKSPKSDQRKKRDGGGFSQANNDFDNVARPKNVKDRGDGVRTGELDDGSTITVRPKSSPSISIKQPGKKKQIKIRY